MSGVSEVKKLRYRADKIMFLMLKMLINATSHGGKTNIDLKLLRK